MHLVIAIGTLCYLDNSLEKNKNGSLYTAINNPAERIGDICFIMLKKHLIRAVEVKNGYKAVVYLRYAHKNVSKQL